MMDIQWMIYSPIIAAVIFLVLYFIGSLFFSSLETKHFIGFLVLGGILGFGVSVIIVVTQTVLYESPQGPLALIYYAPVGVTVGEVFGVIFWIYKTWVSKRPSKYNR